MPSHPKLDELVVFNDEAHHIHDASLAWSRSIQPATLSGTW